MGSSAKFVITGDLTQVDLPPRVQSGLVSITEILAKTRGISFVRLTEQDVIRHKLVKKIIEKFKKFENGDG